MEFLMEYHIECTMGSCGVSYELLWNIMQNRLEYLMNSSGIHWILYATCIKPYDIQWNLLSKSTEYSLEYHMESYAVSSHGGYWISCGISNGMSYGISYDISCWILLHIWWNPMKRLMEYHMECPMDLWHGILWNIIIWNMYVFLSKIKKKSK